MEARLFRAAVGLFLLGSLAEGLMRLTRRAASRLSQSHRPLLVWAHVDVCSSLFGRSESRGSANGVIFRLLRRRGQGTGTITCLNGIQIVGMSGMTVRFFPHRSSLRSWRARNFRGNASIATLASRLTTSSGIRARATARAWNIGPRLIRLPPSQILSLLRSRSRMALRRPRSLL